MHLVDCVMSVSLSSIRFHPQQQKESGYLHKSFERFINITIIIEPDWRALLQEGTQMTSNETDAIIH